MIVIMKTLTWESALDFVISVGLGMMQDRLYPSKYKISKQGGLWYVERDANEKVVPMPSNKLPLVSR